MVWLKTDWPRRRSLARPTCRSTPMPASTSQLKSYAITGNVQDDQSSFFLGFVDIKTKVAVQFMLHIQGSPSGRGKLFVGINLQVPLHVLSATLYAMSTKGCQWPDWPPLTKSQFLFLCEQHIRKEYCDGSPYREHSNAVFISQTTSYTV